MQSVFWSSRRRRLPRTEQEMIWTNQKLPLMIHVLWPGFPFSFSLCSGPMRKDCCFDSAVQEVLCITWEVSDREIAWVVPKPLTSGYVFVASRIYAFFIVNAIQIPKQCPQNKTIYMLIPNCLSSCMLHLTVMSCSTLAKPCSIRQISKKKN